MPVLMRLNINSISEILCSDDRILVSVLQRCAGKRYKTEPQGSLSPVLQAVDGPLERKKVDWPIAVPKRSRPEGHVAIRRVSFSR